MTFGKYIHDKIILLVMNTLGMFLLCVYLLALKNSPTTILLICIVWAAAYGTYLGVDYRGRKRRFDRIDELMRHLDQPYLVQEFMEDSWRLEDQLYQDILHRSNKAVIEQIDQARASQKEYREFIEGWIHQVKLTITGMQLAYHNEKREGDRKIEAYLAEMDNAVERVLFYARSDQVYQDFQVAATSLQQVVVGVATKNKHLLIQNGMSVQLDCDDSVMTDRKWLAFILTQILSNAIKYKKDGEGSIAFRSEEGPDAARLWIRDQGIGIPADELGRVFQKGFTGSNGRSREASTGIGLYLCGKLCRRLEIGIDIASVVDAYTEIVLTFPRNMYLSKL